MIWLAAGLLLLPSAVLSQITIVPSAPKAQERVSVRIAEGVMDQYVPRFDYDLRDPVRMVMSGNKITATLKGRTRGLTVIGPSASIDLQLGQFPAGDYQVEVKVESPAGMPVGTVGTASFAVHAKTPTDPPRDWTDLWWNPDESGWGLNMVQHPSGVIFATLFVYGADGGPTWYVVPDARWVAEIALFRGSLYRTTGPLVCDENTPVGCYFDPSRVTRTLVGTFSFSADPDDRDYIRMYVVIDGQRISRVLMRQDF